MVMNRVGNGRSGSPKVANFGTKSCTKAHVLLLACDQYQLYFVSCTVSVSENSHHIRIPAEIFGGVFRRLACRFWNSESEDRKLVIRIITNDFPSNLTRIHHKVTSTSQTDRPTDGRTDRQTSYGGNTAPSRRASRGKTSSRFLLYRSVV